MTVDSVTGQVHVFYYDQGIAAAGDLTEVTHLRSDDGGVTWKAPKPLSERPFHAGWGNDTGQPNLGDYNQAVAQGGTLFAASAQTLRPPDGFVDGLPSSSLAVPEVFLDAIPASTRNATTASLGAVTFADSGGDGHIDPGEQVDLKLPLRNYVTNALYAQVLRGIQATLSTNTPGVTVQNNTSTYPDLAPGQSAVNNKAFQLKIAPGVVPGTLIELTLTVGSTGRDARVLPFSLFTGMPSATPVLTENFDDVAPGALPAGWTTESVAPFPAGNVVPWTTSDTFCGTTSNAAFHQNANDGPVVSGIQRNRRFERLFSPIVAVPGDAEYVTMDFDVCYDTEDDPAFNVLAFDGFLLRVADFGPTTAPPSILRSVLVEAFQDEFTTGGVPHYPKHFPRLRVANYFEDMSAWAGDSNGVRHVHLRLPGMAGRFVQLRWEYTQDNSGICTDVRPTHTSCGVLVDNIVMNSVQSVVP